LNDKDSKGFVKDRSLLNEFLSFKTFKRRREFIKFCTSRFFKRDLKRKGFKVDDLTCRLCHKRRKISGKEENLAHIIREHPVNVEDKRRTTFKKILDKDVIKIFKLYADGDFIETPKRK